MINRRMDPVSYRPFQSETRVVDGLLSVAREGGDLERKVAMGLARMADEFGRKADRQVAHAGMLAGQRDALTNAPEAATVTGGQITGVETTGGAGGGPVRVSVPPSDLRKMIADAAVRHGVDPHALVTTAGIESSFNPRAKNPASSAGGLFQFVDGTARQYGLADRFDPAQASDAAARLMRDNAGHLRKVLGREPNAGELYLAHQQGAGGASRLLANPNARAVDIVGADAVRLNGGDASMTAGQFAVKWTSKAGGGSYNRLPSASSVGPISVTPVREPVKIEPGKAGTWRPTGRDTVYGRAYDVSGTRTYLEMIDLAMDQNTTAIYEAYKDDPAQLEKALGEGLTADLRDNVFEEIAPEYTVAYRKRADGLLSKARTEQRKREDERNRVDFLGRVEDLENLKSRRLAGYDPNDTAAANDIAGVQASIDAHWDSAVARGIVDLSQAEKYKRASRSDTTVGFYTAQAANRPADDIRALRASMKADYAAGKLAGVGADDWDRIEKGLSAAEMARRTQDEKAGADLRRRGDEIARRVARGLPVSPQDIARLQLDAGTAPNGREVVSSTLLRLRVAEAIRSQPIGVVERNVKALVGENATAEDVAFAQKAIADHRGDLRSDPLGVAERFGVLPVSGGLPLDGDVDPDTVSSAFSERINAAKAAASHFGVQPKFFRPGEAEQIEVAIKADPERGLDLAAGLVDAAGDDADRILAELGAAAPALSLSGGLIAAGGNRQAALDLIAGHGKTPDGKAYADMPQTKRIPDARSIAGTALAFTPSEVNRLDQAAAAIARKRLYDAGIDPKKEDAKAVYERAYQEAAGASFAGDVQYGGFAYYAPPGWWYGRGRVLVPPSVRADKLPDLVEALTDADLGGVKGKNGKAWTARDFARAMPVAVKGGFAFAQGDLARGAPVFIADEKGDPVVLDLVGMRRVLDARVPGAYR